MFFVSPGLFCLLSLIVAMSAVASGEQEEAKFAEAKQKEKELNQIMEVLKKREEEKVRSFHYLHHCVCHVVSISLFVMMHDQHNPQSPAEGCISSHIGGLTLNLYGGKSLSRSCGCVEVLTDEFF